MGVYVRSQAIAQGSDEAIQGHRSMVEGHVIREGPHGCAELCRGRRRRRERARRRSPVGHLLPLQEARHPRGEVTELLAHNAVDNTLLLLNTLFLTVR